MNSTIVVCGDQEGLYKYSVGLRRFRLVSVWDFEPGSIPSRGGYGGMPLIKIRNITELSLKYGVKPD